MYKTLAFVAIACLGSSAALAQEGVRPYSESVQHACASLGLNPTEAPYLYCEMSLQDWVRSGARALSVKLARNDCSRNGYRTGTAEFANCVLDQQENFSAEYPPASTLESVNVLGSYQRGDQRTSVRRACADIGVAPESAAYESCVGDLNMTLDDSNSVGSD